MGSLKQLPFNRIEEITFRVYSNEEIEKLSVASIKNEISLNSLGHLIENSIYDLKLGPMSIRDEEFCKTCNNKYYNCSGHFGHIDLPLPIYNPFFTDIIRDLLSKICPSCHRFQVKAHRGIQFIYESMLCSSGYAHHSLDVASDVSSHLLMSKEAVEVSTIEESEEPDRDISEQLNTVHSLHKMLKTKMSALKKEEEPTLKETSNSQAIYKYIQKSFLSDTKPSGTATCRFCKAFLIKTKYENSQLLIKSTISKKKKKKNESGTDDPIVAEEVLSKSQPYITPKQAQKILRECYNRDGYLIKFLYPFLRESKLAHPTDAFFIEKLLVTPPRFRPIARLNGILVENEISFLYKAVVRMSKCLRYMVQHMDKPIDSIPIELRDLVAEFKGETMMEKSHTIWQELQNSVDNILDSEINTSSKIAYKGVRQIIEKKFGLFRRNLMGKRVNYSARSVAAPDPMLAVDEVGVPQDFAVKLTYPVPVTPWNVSKLRNLVENGPLNYPGALMVEDEEGKRITLKPNDSNQRTAIAKALLTPAESCANKVNATKIVFRHLQNGDYVLMNRQPTLHKPSIQAHKARVMQKDRVLRLPYANCKAYNADFDGDELNLHFPQNEMARSESEYIITTRNQYLTHKDGSPLAGLIQDCVVASVMLTIRGKFFNIEDYQQLIYVALSDCSTRRLKLMIPAILKPQKLWSGKQVISTILLNLIPANKAKPSFKFKTSVKVDLWQKEEERHWNGAGGAPEKNKESMTESEFIIRDGELVCGVVDKCAIGSTSFGLVHLCYELYGGRIASHLLTSVNRLCVTYLQWVGHTISLKEFVTTPLASRRRRKALMKLVQGAEDEVCDRLGVTKKELRTHFETVHKSQNEKEIAVIDAAYTAVLGPATSNITKENEKRLLRNGLVNRMRMMVDTGAKGSKVNLNQMASLFGSVAIDGKRMPMSVTGKTLPVFKPFDCDPRAGGYIKTRFVTGMEPRSYFFLCIVGRDSLQHTAVKTANSGYMQRCLIKHLEGIKVEYDMTVRNSDGVVLQFDYGEDGMDVAKMPFLRNVDTLQILGDNSATIDQTALAPLLAAKKPHLPRLQKWVNKYKKNFDRSTRSGGFLSFSREKKRRENSPHRHEPYPGRTEDTTRLLKRWNSLPEAEKQIYIKPEKDLLRGRDPVASTENGSLNFGVVSEALDDLIDQYYDQKYSGRKSTKTKQEVVTSLHMKAFTSRVEPGEAVGALCAQAIGEPLTQMTLNTFHFAGRDELNVTLGVPRMIEILRVASANINTPIMEVPFKEGVSPRLAEKLKIKLTPVPLEKVLNRVSVCTWLERGANFFNLLRHTELEFHFLPRKEYKDTYFVKPRDVLHYIEKAFLKKIIKAIKAAIDKVNLYASSSLSENAKDDDEDEVDPSSEINLNREIGEEDSDEDEELETVEDAGISGSARTLKKKEVDYSEDEGEEEDIEGQVERKEVDEGEKGKDELVEGLPDNETKTAQDRNKNQQKSKKSVNTDVADIEFAMRVNMVKSQDSWIMDYSFDRSKNLWCKVSLGLPIAEGRYDLASILQHVTESTLVHSVPGIKKALVVEKDNRLLLRTEGVNIYKMYSFENILDVNQLYTNNIHLMAQRYGIEAAQRTIIKEIKEVQSAYDIRVDFRHLSLLADYFTREGLYKACSRFAIDTCASPIQKMSYETCFQFMKKALLQGLPDDMSSPSAKVMVGQPVQVGTNSMQILCKLSTEVS